jgi:hypothetical protein
VRGFADQRLRNLKDPLDPSNRRISIIVQNLTTKVDGNPEEGEKASPGEKLAAEGAQGGKRKIPESRSAPQKE